jgi:hypothetical protein
MSAPERPSGSGFLRGCLAGVLVLGLLGAVAAGAVVWVAFHVAQSPPPQTGAVADRFLEAMAAGRWADASRFCAPEIAADLEAAGKAAPDVWGAKGSRSSTSSKSNVSVTGFRVESVFRTETMSAVKGKDGKEREVRLEFTNEVIQEVRVDGTRIAPAEGNAK